MSNSLNEPLWESNQGRFKKESNFLMKIAIAAGAVICILFILGIIWIVMYAYRVPSVVEVAQFFSASTSLKLAFSPDDTFLAYGTQSGNIEVWNIETKTKLASIFTSSSISGISISNDSKHLITFSDDVFVRVFSLESFSQIGKLEHPDKVIALEITKDNQYVVTLCKDSIIRVWNLETKYVENQFSKTGSVITSFDLESYSQILTFGTQEGHFAVWRFNYKTLVSTFELGKPIVSVKIGLDGEHVAIQCQDGTFVRYDINDKEKLTSYSPTAGKSVVAISDSASYAVVAGDSITVINLEDNNQNKEFKDGGRVTALTIASDNYNLISATTDKIIRVWSLPRSTEIARVGCEGIVESIVISNDYKYFITGGNDGWVRVFSYYP